MSEDSLGSNGGEGLEESDLEPEIDPADQDAADEAAVTMVPVADFKVLGELSDPTSVGVLGQNNASSGSAYGVQGVSRSDEGVANLGRATTTSQATDLARPVGVEGLTSAPGDAQNGNAPVGVRGRSTGSGVTGGILGQADSTNGLGVIGESTTGDVTDLLPLIDDQNFSAGVLGFTDRTSANASIDNAFGVIGIAADPDNTNAQNVGVYGRTRSEGGYGVYSDDRIFARANASNTDYAAKFVDFSSGGSSQAVLDLSIRDGSPNNDDNFIRFLAGGSADTESALGAIEANSAGDGINVRSGSADIAEYFPKADPDERFDPGTVVGLTDGEITRETASADTVGVVSEAPMMSGNVPRDADEDDYARIALVGQVEVEVGADATAGDLLVADGAATGRAVPRSDHDGTAPLVVGIALADGESGERVPTLVGGNDGTPADGHGAAREEVEELRETVERQAETIERLEERLDALEASGTTARATGDD